jgi:hypothetical protein
VTTPDPARLTAAYAFQDEVLRLVSSLGTGFYLTGGAAAARGYLGHRAADALDLVVDDDPRFGAWSEQVVTALTASPEWTIELLEREPRLVRFGLARGGQLLPVGLSSDAFAHVGEITVHQALGRLSSAENLLADLVTALADDMEPDDLADLWAFCCRDHWPVVGALEAARRKGAEFFPIDLARVVAAASRADWEVVRWIAPPPAERYLGDLHRLSEDLLLFKA